MKKIFLSLLIIGLALVSFAKSEENKTETTTPSESVASTELTGIVTDKVSNEALVGVEVEIEGANQKVYTDFDGKFTFNNLKAGEYNVVASYISYEKNIIQHVNVNNNSNKLSIQLESSN